MSLLARILARDKARSVPKKQTDHKTFYDFLEMAGQEIDELIAENPNWYQELPYNAPIGKDQARELEIEKRAVWRRVIYDAQRSKLSALRWDCMMDEKSDDECTKRNGKLFYLNEYEELDKIRMHVGCRCNLMPVREPEETGEE